MVRPAPWLFLSLLGACSGPVPPVLVQPPPTYCERAFAVPLLELGVREQAEVVEAGDRLLYAVTSVDGGALLSTDRCGQDRRALLEGIFFLQRLPSGAVLACGRDDGRVYWMEPDGGGEPRALFEDVDCSTLAESPTAFFAFGRGTWERGRPLLRSARQAGGAVGEVLHPAAYPPLWLVSGDTGLLVSGGRELLRIGLSTGAATPVEPAVFQVQPAPDSTRVAVVKLNGEVRLLTLSTGASVPLMEVTPPAEGPPFDEVAWSTDGAFVGVFGDTGNLDDLRRIPAGEKVEVPAHGSAAFVPGGVLLSKPHRCPGCASSSNDWMLWAPSTGASTVLAEDIPVTANVDERAGVLWIAVDDLETAQGPLELIPLDGASPRRRYERVGVPAVELPGGGMASVIDRTRRPGTEQWNSSEALWGRLELAFPGTKAQPLATEVRAYPAPQRVGPALIFHRIDAVSGRSVVWATAADAPAPPPP